jgi:predicted  nucleic acid-binding Zn-ribbon protein
MTYQDYWSDTDKKKKMDTTCSMHVKIRKFYRRLSEAKRSLGVVSVNGRITAVRRCSA